MRNDLGQDLLLDIQAAAQEVQSKIKSEIRRNYLLRAAVPLVILGFLWINRKG